MKDHELFAAIGLVLYGENWHGDMARARKVRVTTVREWAAGKGAPIPPGVWTELHAAVTSRRGALDVLLPRILQAKAEAETRH